VDIRLAEKSRWLATAGGVLGFVGVAAGAFGAHALKSSLAPEQLTAFETAVRYQMVHALALFACAWVLRTWPNRLAFAAGVLFLFGTVLFSGSLYAIALGGNKGFGAITPVGGAGFLIGWILLTLSVAGRHKAE
jgi:uncharacterized membrane protein YgdD (TMEM256/DUF423 family)